MIEYPLEVAQAHAEERRKLRLTIKELRAELATRPPAPKRRFKQKAFRPLGQTPIVHHDHAKKDPCTRTCPGHRK